MHLPGSVAQRTRGKKAEFYKQYFELNKKALEEKSVSKETESVSVKESVRKVVQKGNSSQKKCVRKLVQKGNSCEKESVRKVSGFRSGGGCSGDATRDDIGSLSREYSEFLETDHRYEMYLSCYYDSSRRSDDKRSGFSGSEEVRTNLTREDVSCSDDSIIGDDDSINIGETSDNSISSLQVTDLIEDNVNTSDNDGNVGDVGNLQDQNCILQSDTDLMEEEENGGGDDNDDMNFSETSEDDLQLETRECVIVSDDDDDCCAGAINGDVNTYQTYDSGNLHLETNMPEDHANISKDDNGDENDGTSLYETSEDNTVNLQRGFHKESEANCSDDHNEESSNDDIDVCEISDDILDQQEPSGMHLDVEAESVRSFDAYYADKSCEDTSEESEFSSEEDSQEDDEDEDYIEETSYSDDEELSSEFEEEQIEHLMFSKKNGSNKDDAEIRKSVAWSSASDIDLSSEYEDEEEDQFVFTRKDDRRKDDANNARKNVSWSSASGKELGSGYEEEEEEKIVVSKKNDPEKVKKEEAETEMMRRNMSCSSDSGKELGSDNEEVEEEKMEVAKKNDAEKVKQYKGKTEVTRKSVSRSSNSDEELGGDHEEEEQEQFEFCEISTSRRGKEDNADSQKRKSVFRNYPERKRSNTYESQGKCDVSLLRGGIKCACKLTRSLKLMFTSVPQPIEKVGDGNDNNDDSETNRSNVTNNVKEESGNQESGSMCAHCSGKGQTSNVKGEENLSVGRKEEEGGNEDVKNSVTEQRIKVEREEERWVERKGEWGNKRGWDKRVKEKPTSSMRKRIKTSHDVVKILTDSILEDSEIPFEEKKEPITKPSLPLKFTFGAEELIPPEKSEEEKEMDQLWAEMAIALCETVCENNVEVDVGSGGVEEVELNRDAKCERGDHDFIIDDEIGLKCKYCFYVKTESKYLHLPFSKNPFGRSGRRGSVTVQDNTLEDLHDQMADNSGSVHDSDLLKRGTVWDIIPGIDKGMHPHQKDGFEFLWRNIAGDIHIEEQKEVGVGGENGCVISHAPGTGKTRLTIAFLQTYVKQYPSCKAVIIAPCGMLPTWEAEFQKWKVVDIPFHNLNSGELSGKENSSALRLASNVKLGRKDKLARMVKLYSWAKDRGILGMSYRLFAEMVGAAKTNNFIEEEAKKNRKILFEQTGLLVLDEGHTARNESSLIWQALSKVHTKKRIILSGTPFQNNFDELYNFFWLARPKFAEDIPGKRHELPKRRGRKKNKNIDGRLNWGSITDQISREKDDSLKAQPLAQLRELIGPFVHIHKGNILQEKLPGLRDSVIVLEPCKLQKQLLDNPQIKNQRYYFGKEYMISLLSVHPSLLLECESALQKISHDIDGVERILRQVRLNPEVGIKTKFLIELIRLCEAVGERVLLFSQYIDPLDFIIEQLKSQFEWREGREILYIHGKLDVDKRQQLIKEFNDRRSAAKVLLASIKACSEGINLVGASRVVLLDVVWNPSVERQAISRAYRLGQERVVHIYHLITSGTMEEEKFCRQSKKDRLSTLVFDSEDKGDGVEKIRCNVSDEKTDLILQHMRDHEKLKDMFKNVIYQPKDSNLIESFGFLD